MPRCATYRVYYVLNDGSTRERNFAGAPKPEAIWHNRPIFLQSGPKAIFAIRYYPSRKAWRTYNLTEFGNYYLRSGRIMLRVPPFSETPDLDAAIMAARFRL